MTTWPVSTVAEFNSARDNDAVAGDTIQIAAGTYASTLSLSNKVYVGSPLTITVTGDVNLFKVQCKKTENVVWDFTDGAGGKRNVKFENAGAGSGESMWDLHGAISVVIKNGRFEGITSNAFPYGHCFYIIAQNGQRNNDVRIEDCTIDSFYRGIVSWDGDFLSIKRNKFLNMTGDNIQFGEVTDCLVEGNDIRSVVGDGPGGVHSDGIQISTYGGLPVAKRMTIRGNTFDVQDGPDWFQCIFLANELWAYGGRSWPALAGTDGARFEDFLIENNVIYGVHSHGITVDACDGVIVRNNTLVRPNFDDPRAAEPTIPNIYPQININQSGTDITCTDNVAWATNITTNYTGTLTNTGNILIDETDYDANFDQGAKPYGTYAVGPNQWTVLEGSAIDTAGVGAPSMLPVTGSTTAVAVGIAGTSSVGLGTISTGTFTPEVLMIDGSPLIIDGNILLINS